MRHYRRLLTLSLLSLRQLVVLKVPYSHLVRFAICSDFLHHGSPRCRIFRTYITFAEKHTKARRFELSLLREHTPTFYPLFRTHVGVSLGSEEKHKACNILHDRFPCFTFLASDFFCYSLYSKSHPRFTGHTRSEIAGFTAFRHCLLVPGPHDAYIVFVFCLSVCHLRIAPCIQGVTALPVVHLRSSFALHYKNGSGGICPA